MKIIVLLTSLIFLGNILVAQEGIAFQPLQLEEALLKAKKENKFVFMEIHSSGCAACVLMEEEVFPRPEMGSFFNSQFICVSYNTSLSENKALRDKYPTYYIPAFFILRPDGGVYHKFIGAYPADQFIAIVKNALNENNSYSYLEKRYQAGDTTKEELLAFTKALNDFGDKQAETMMKKLSPQLTLQDSLSVEFFPLISNINDITNRNFFFRHIESLKKNLGKEKVENILLNDYHTQIKKYLPSPFGPKSTPNFTNLQKEIEQSQLTDKELLLNEIGMLRAIYDKEYPRSIDYLQKVVKHPQADPYLLNSVIYQIVENGPQEELKKLLSLEKEILTRGEQTFIIRNLRRAFEQIRQKTS